MKNIFQISNKGYMKQADYQDQMFLFIPKNFNDCVDLARQAVHLSRFKDERSKQLWLQIIDTSRALQLNIKQLFEAQLPDGKTILEACIDAQDWDSCLEFVFALPPGRYCDGRILLKNRALILDEDGPENQKGILVTPKGSYYAGDLKAGKQHGKGILKEFNGDIFEGEFKNNQMHGWGESRDAGSNHILLQGLFIEGKWIGNPREIKPSRSNGIRGYFFK